MKTYDVEVQSERHVCSDKDGGGCVRLMAGKRSTFSAAKVLAKAFWRYVAEEEREHVKVLIIHIQKGDDPGCMFWDVSRQGKVREYDFINH